MTAPSPTARPAPAPALAAALAGIVVLAFVGAPQSVNIVLLAGFDQPKVVGTQLLIGLAGAVGTGVAVLLVRLWAPLTLFGGLLVTLSYLVHPVVHQGIQVEAVAPGQPEETPDVVANAGWVALLVGGGAVVLVGVLGAAGQLIRTGSRRAGTAVAGLGAASGYLGTLLVSWLPSGWPRVVVLVVMVLVLVAAVVVGRSGAGSPLSSRMITLAWVAALLPVVPTITVAITDQTTYESTAGMVVCVLVLAGALVTAAAAGIPVLRSSVGAGLVLAAPAPLLVLILADAEETSLWACAVPTLVVMGVFVALAPRPLVVAGVIVEAAAVALLAIDGIDDSGEWVVYVLAAAVVAGAVSAGAGVADGQLLPVLVPVVTAVAVGIRVVLDAIQLKPSIAGLGSLFGSGSMWLSVVMLVVGALVLVVRPAVGLRR